MRVPTEFSHISFYLLNRSIAVLVLHILIGLRVVGWGFRLLRATLYGRLSDLGRSSGTTATSTTFGGRIRAKSQFALDLAKPDLILRSVTINMCNES